MARQTELLTSYLWRWQRARFHAAVRRRMNADLQRYLPAASQAVAAMRAGRDFLAMGPSELPNVAESCRSVRMTWAPFRVDAKAFDEFANTLRQR